MTLLVCHRDDGAVTLLADTRISGQLGALTDTGPKVLTVPVLVSHGSEAPLPPVRATFGFACAGSTLAAMSTYALVSTCLQSLVTPETPRAPSVASVADLFRRIGQRYAREVASPFDCFVVGPGEDGGEPRAFSNMSRIEDGVLVVVSSELDQSRRGLWALGSGAIPYMRFAQEERPWRTIVESVQAFISANVDPKVGGHLQAGTCDADGFAPMMTLQLDREAMSVTSAFLGVGEDELGLIDGLDLGVNALGPREAFEPGRFTRRPIEGRDGVYVGYWKSPDVTREEP